MDTPLAHWEAAAQPVAMPADLLVLAPPFPTLAVAWRGPLGAATPERLYALVGGGSYRLLLESVTAGPAARYSFLTGAPLLLVWHRAGQTFLHVTETAVTRCWAGDPFVVLAALPAHYRPAAAPVDDTPFAAGLAGYWGYGLRGWVEPRLPRRPDPLGLPDCLLGLYAATLTVDHATDTVIATGTATDIAAWRATLAAAQTATPLPPAAARVPAAAVARNFGPASYAAAVQRVRDYIWAGDIYQANLTQRFGVPCPDDPWTVYRRLRAANPAPFAAYMPWPGGALVSASPERFLQSDGYAVETQPIKGTRPRGATPAEDRRLAAELAASAKDRAENVMIVDLLRNDLGRVCVFGSVQVPELLALATVGPPRNEWSPLTRCKTLNYGDNILARQAAARLGADEALLGNTTGAVVGVSVANLFLVAGDRLITPSLESGCLPGITRAVLVELAAAQGIPTVERPVRPAEVAAAAEVFLT
ncbi:MAG: bifunctional anthranilate synthase component I family protein/class IV aminotransferase, partial [Chloroflexota bacterium]|nr:bifunctional anthranilate synthase component I family protein/class IV aminotransferase [Chloroflexota bacterium]